MSVFSDLDFGAQLRLFRNVYCLNSTPLLLFFFLNDPAPPKISPLPLPDPLPIPFIDEATIGLLDAHPETRLVFTLGVYDDILKTGPKIGYPPDSRRRVEVLWDRMVAAVRLAYELDRKSTRLNSSHSQISYAVFCL